MSRIGKQLVIIPEKTEVSVSKDSITVKGPLGELSRPIHSAISVAIENNQVKVSPVDDSISSRALWGTYTSHINNMVLGVNKVFEKKLIVEGIGYKVQFSGNTLELQVGFSHPVKIEVPKGITVSVEKNTISISGYDKELVGQFTAQVRSIKKPEPYKGKGIRYDDEVIKRKQGKKVVS